MKKKQDKKTHKLGDEKIMVYVKGVTHDNRQLKLKKLYEKYITWKPMVVKLKPEPDNKFDRNAIKVILNKKHIGYIPMAISKMIKLSMKEGLISKVNLYDIYKMGNIYGANIMVHF